MRLSTKGIPYVSSLALLLITIAASVEETRAAELPEAYSHLTVLGEVLDYSRDERSVSLECEEGAERALADEVRRAASTSVPLHPEESLLAKLLDEAVSQALEALPERYRVPILLFDVEGFSYKQIAYIMDIPDKTVKSRLYTARQRLKGILSRARAVDNG